MNKWNVYVKLHESFSRSLDCVEFDYKNVEIEDTANYVTLYDEDGTLAFRCYINDIAKFVKYK